MQETITAKMTLDLNFERVQDIRRAFQQPDRLAKFEQAITNLAAQHLGAEYGPLNLRVAVAVSRPHRARSGAKLPTPQVEKGLLTWYDPDADRVNTVGKVGGRAWFEWLEEEGNGSFSYVSKDRVGFTAIRRANGVWYAHKRLGGKLKRKYLGKAGKLTAAKLDAVAFELAQRELTAISN